MSTLFMLFLFASPMLAFCAFLAFAWISPAEPSLTQQPKQAIGPNIIPFPDRKMDEKAKRAWEAITKQA